VSNEKFCNLGLNPVTLEAGLMDEVVEITQKYQDRCNTMRSDEMKSFTILYCTFCIIAHGIGKKYFQICCSVSTPDPPYLYSI
jgi:hypothetical protein